MSKASDVIVIGAGCRRMRRRLLSGKARGKGNSSGAQGSCLRCIPGANGSGARQSGRDNRELPLAMFGVKHIWPTLGEELGEDIEYIQNGNMRLGKTEKDREALEELVRQNSSLGLDVRMVYGQDIRELIPDVSPEVQYATYCPTDGHANPMRTTLALYKRARELGAQFITNIKVLKLEKVAGRIRRVHTDDGIYEADSVILCGGIWLQKDHAHRGAGCPYAASADRGVRHRAHSSRDRQVYLRRGWLLLCPAAAQRNLGDRRRQQLRDI